MSSNKKSTTSSKLTSPKPPSSSKKSSKKQSKILTAVSDFEWVEVKPVENGEINYLSKFFQNHPGAAIDYKRLDIPRSDPNPENNRESRFDIASIHTRLSKWGGLSMEGKKDKNEKEIYDLDDSFIDDNDARGHSGANVGCVESTFEDFVCIGGDMKSFKNSKYYQERLKSIKKSIQVQAVKKKKKSSRGTSVEKTVSSESQEKKKPAPKRKRSGNKEEIVRPAKESKAVKTKKLSEASNSSGGSSKIQVEISKKD